MQLEGVKKDYNQCNFTFNNKIGVFLCNDDCTSFANYDEGKIVLFTKSDTFDFYNSNDQELLFKPVEIRTFVHEIGHAFGGLRDEYTSESKPDAPSYPNCAPSADLGLSWWQELFPEMELFNGCSYTPDNFRFNSQSIMSNDLSDTFGPINQFYLCYKIFLASGSVNAGLCTDFLKVDFEPVKN